jgi:hypothetical protein
MPQKMQYAQYRITNVNNQMTFGVKEIPPGSGPESALDYGGRRSPVTFTGHAPSEHPDDIKFNQSLI